MRKLEKILKINDGKERIRTLLEYARFLDVDIDVARNEEGELIENRLIMLIYDGEEAQKFQRNKNIGIWVASFVISLALLVVVWVVNVLRK